MKGDRLLSALLLLQAHGRLNARELAERLEVSLRTVHRDMDALSAAGVPVFALRGAQGGWQLDENWRTQVPGLDDAELRALLLAQPRSLGDSRLAAAGERAISKLLASLPNAARERAAAIRQRLYVDDSGWRGTPENLAALPTVQDALARDRKLSILYRSQSGSDEVERIVDPLGLVAKGTTWYLFAQTPAGNRTYRISRIHNPKILDQPSVRPPRFDLAAAWKASTQQFTAGRPPYYATLRIEPATAEFIAAYTAMEAAEDPRPGAKWVTRRVMFDTEDQATFVVLGLGPKADVIEPESLRRRVSASLEASLKRIRKKH